MGAGRKDWLAWTGVEGDFELRRVRWALAEARSRTRHILVEPGVNSPGWWEVHGRSEPFGVARGRLEQAGARSPGRLAALVDLEPEAVEWLALLLERGVDEKFLGAELARGWDPGTTVGRLSAEHGLVAEKDLVLGKASLPLMRAFGEEPGRVSRLRKAEVAVLVERIRKGEQLPAEDAAWWSASTRASPPWQADGLGRRGDSAEALLRNERRTGWMWEQAASAAWLAFVLRALGIAQDRLGPHHPVTAQVLHRVAQIQEALSKPEAAATARQAHEALLKSLGIVWESATLP